MAKQRYALYTAVLLGISAVLLLFIFVLVGHHRAVVERVEARNGPAQPPAAEANLRTPAKRALTAPASSGALNIA